jgi:hypothetical protein
MDIGKLNFLIFFENLDIFLTLLPNVILDIYELLLVYLLFLVGMLLKQRYKNKLNLQMSFL